jgi:hypothetical protein
MSRAGAEIPEQAAAPARALATTQLAALRAQWRAAPSPT